MNTRYVLIDDRDGAIDYTGAWSPTSGDAWNSRGEFGTTYLNTLQSTAASSASFSFTFDGTPPFVTSFERRSRPDILLFRRRRSCNGHHLCPKCQDKPESKLGVLPRWRRPGEGVVLRWNGKQLGLLQVLQPFSWETHHSRRCQVKWGTVPSGPNPIQAYDGGQQPRHDDSLHRPRFNV